MGPQIWPVPSTWRTVNDSPIEEPRRRAAEISTVKGVTAWFAATGGKFTAPGEAPVRVGDLEVAGAPDSPVSESARVTGSR